MTEARLAPAGPSRFPQPTNTQTVSVHLVSGDNMDSPPLDNTPSIILRTTDRPIMTDMSSGHSPIMTTSHKQPPESRKANKPLMEKRRRARINKSLNELKSILMESMERNSPGHSKWEKADILEMTVQYLHCLRNQRKASRSDPLAVGQFIAGYSECIRQVQKFAVIRNSASKSGKIPFSTEVQDKLTSHLLSYLKTFSDDATRALQTVGPHCPSPPSNGTGSSDASGFGSGDGSPPSRQSTLSSFASPSPRSPNHDSMDSDDGETLAIFPTHPGGPRRDMNNNASRMILGASAGCERDVGNQNGGVWRPW